MNLLLDTNILINLTKDPAKDLLNNLINPTGQKIFISIVTIGEVKSIGLRNGWGAFKWRAVNRIIDGASIVEINESLVTTYAEIDAFSQRRNPAFSNYLFDTPRNMGKNDLWLAATAALLGLKLVTTDGDFKHLHDVFLEVKQITPSFFL